MLIRSIRSIRVHPWLQAAYGSSRRGHRPPATPYRDASIHLRVSAWLSGCGRTPQPLTTRTDIANRHGGGLSSCVPVNLPSPTDYISVFKTTTRGRWDLLNPIALAGLSTFGVLFIYSAQLPVHGNSWITQIVWLTGGLGLYLAVSLIDYRFWLSVAHWFYAACLLPLLLVLLPGIGSERYGSQRWIDFGFFSFQPSETAKVAVLLITASVLIRSEIGTVRQSLGVLGKLALAVGTPMFLILLQPDLKSAIVLPPMVFSMLYVSKLSSRFFAAALGAFLLILGIVSWDTWRYEDFMESHGYSYMNDRGKYEPQTWVPLHDYQRNRIISFVSPDKIDPMGIGWNQRQSLISVGSGGLSGKGWTRGHAGPARLPAALGRAQRFHLLGHRRGTRFSGKHHGSRPLWDSVVQRHSHRRSRSGPLRHPSRHWRDGAVRGARVREHRNDHRAGAHHGHTASLYQLRWLLRAQLLFAARTGPERLSLPEGFHMRSLLRVIDRFAGISCAATAAPGCPVLQTRRYPP